MPRERFRSFATYNDVIGIRNSNRTVRDLSVQRLFQSLSTAIIIKICTKYAAVNLLDIEESSQIRCIHPVDEVVLGLFD